MYAKAVPWQQQQKAAFLTVFSLLNSKNYRGCYAEKAEKQNGNNGINENFLQMLSRDAFRGS